jgi:acetylornithine deacetylase/succinyl-diaminopimelate desuccinylase-like protein
MKATNINWDVTDGAEEMTEEEIQEVLSTLPAEVEIPSNITDSAEDDDIEEIISDWLSDTYGFCHNGFDIQ